MKKMHIFLMICLMTICLQAKVFAQAPSIDSTRIIPLNPTDNDSVNVIVYTSFATGPCSLDTFMLGQQDSAIHIMLNYMVGDAATTCHSVDTINIGLFDAGNYQLKLALSMNVLQAVFDSDSLSFTVSKTLSLSHISDGNVLFLHPNPATDKIYIQNVKTPTTLKVYNVIGKAILNTQLSANKDEVLQISDWPSAIYLFEFADSHGNKQIRRIVKRN